MDYAIFGGATMQAVNDNDGIKFSVTLGDDDGFVVVYRDEDGYCVWSEYHESLELIRTIYRHEIANGQFDGSQNN